jgi:hypothetical protein
VLDDIARGGWRSDHDPGILYAIVNYRSDHLLPTVVTSNNKDLAATFGLAVTRRLREEIGGNPAVVIDFGSGEIPPEAPQR